MIISTKKGTPKEELEKIVDRFEKQGLDVTLITGKDYKFFNYYGHPEADRLIVVMGSGASVARGDFLSSMLFGLVFSVGWTPLSLIHI